jgi:hypothetical protein
MWQDGAFGGLPRTMRRCMLFDAGSVSQPARPAQDEERWWTSSNAELNRSSLPVRRRVRYEQVAQEVGADAGARGIAAHEATLLLLAS